MFRKTLLAAVATVAMSAPCFALPMLSAGSQFNIGGFDQGIGSTTIDNATGLDFTDGVGPTRGTAGTIQNSNGTGDFAAFGTCISACGSIKDILSFAGFVSTSNFFTTANVSFDLDSPLSITRIAGRAGTQAKLLVDGFGTFHTTGFDATPGSFTLTTQGGLVTTFSASTIAQPVATPEPMSLALLGTGLVGLGLIRRRKA